VEQALGDLLRANAKKGVKSDYVFLNEHGQPFGRMGISERTFFVRQISSWKMALASRPTRTSTQ